MNSTKFDVAGIPLVSIIMPAYNAGNYIEASIQSVREQTFPNWELIIVDDGSTDNTAEKIKYFEATDKRIRYVFQKNRKQAAARNNGIGLARGKWIAFLDADDLWMPDKLAKQFEIANEGQCDFIFSNGYYLHEDNQVLEPYDSLSGRYEGAELFRILFQHNYIPVLSVMLKKSLTVTIGKQDESLTAYGCEDWDYWLRCAKTGVNFFGLNERLFKYRVHSRGTSSNKLSMQMAGCYVMFKNFNEDLFKREDLPKAKERLKNEIKVIVHGLYEQGKTVQVPYYLKLLSSLGSNKVKFAVATFIVKLLKRKSRRFTEFVLYH